MIKIDDILAAVVLTLVMLRRLEAKTARPEQNPHVSPENFQRWRALALRAFDRAALASAAKVLLSLGWYSAAVALGVGAPWFQLVGLAVFIGWLVNLVWAWKIGTDARHLRLQLGIQLRRAPAAPKVDDARGIRAP